MARRAMTKIPYTATATRIAQITARPLPVRLRPTISWVARSTSHSFPTAISPLAIRPYTAQAPSPIRAEAAAGLANTWK